MERSKIPSSEFVFPSRFGVSSSETTPAIPTVPTGKGFPYAGQSETDASTLYKTATSETGGAEKAQGKSEGPQKSFFAQNWHYLIIAFLIMRLLGNAGDQKADAAKPGSAPAPAAN